MRSNGKFPRRASQSQKRSSQRGGSNASSRVEALSPKTCSEFRFPDAIHDVITNRARQQNVGKAYQIGAGRAAPASWFVATFIPALAARVQKGDAPNSLLSYMMRTWNRHATSSSQRLTRAMAMKMLSEFTRANLSGGAPGKARVVLPIEWFLPDGLAVQRGGAAGAAVCSPTSTTLGHTYDNYYKHRGNFGDSAAPGSSIPQNAYQDVQKWFNGETTLFSPSQSDPVNHSGVQWRTQSQGGNLAAQRVPANFDQTVEVNKMLSSDGTPCLTKCHATANVFPGAREYTPNDVRMPTQRAGGTHKNRRRKSRSVRRRA